VTFYANLEWQAGNVHYYALYASKSETGAGGSKTQEVIKTPIIL
jgi:hypothetical protein